MFVVVLLFFFFKQKTAYEMRISDWSSDVCSSDLLWVEHRGDRTELDDRQRAGQCFWPVFEQQCHRIATFNAARGQRICDAIGPGIELGVGPCLRLKAQRRCLRLREIGRASCSDSVCQYV